jgi:hypothetical protein
MLGMVEPVTSADWFGKFDSPELSASFEDLVPTLIAIHEQEHLKTLTSTPLGLLLWRIEQCLRVDIFYFVRRAGHVPVGMGYPCWFEALCNRANSLQDVFDDDRIRDIFYHALNGCSTIKAFLQVLTHRTNATIGDFIELANESFQYLAVRSGLDPADCPVWSSRIPPDAPLLQKYHPTLLGIMEASARARELTKLEWLNAPDATISQWLESSIFGVYHEAFSLLHSKLGTSIWIKAVVDIALSTPIDIVAAAKGEILYVEDVLPSYRLDRIANALRGATLPLSSSKYQNDLCDVILKRAGLPLSRPLYERLANPTYTEEANWGGSLGNEYMKHVEERFRKNFKLRLDDCSYFFESKKPSQESRADRPDSAILTFFSDHLFLEPSVVVDKMSLIISAFDAQIRTAVSQRLLTGEYPLDISHLIKLMEEQFRGIFGDEFDRSPVGSYLEHLREFVSEMKAQIGLQHYM